MGAIKLLDPTRKLNVLDLYSGSGGVGDKFKKLGHNVTSLDIEQKFNPDICIDILKFKPSIHLPGTISGQTINKLQRKYPFDVVWASPPCNKFSKMSYKANWNKVDGVTFPISRDAKNAIAILNKTLEIINILAPRYWFIENPEGMMSLLPIMQAIHKKNITYCQYGFDIMKPTHIFTNFIEWKSRKRCAYGAKCHDAAPRGSNGGIQGMSNAYVRGLIPPLLIEEIIFQMLNGPPKKNLISKPERI